MGFGKTPQLRSIPQAARKHSHFLLLAQFFKSKKNIPKRFRQMRRQVSSGGRPDFAKAREYPFVKSPKRHVRDSSKVGDRTISREKMVLKRFIDADWVISSGAMRRAIRPLSHRSIKEGRSRFRGETGSEIVRYSRGNFSPADTGVSVRYRTHNRKLRQAENACHAGRA